MKLPNRRKNGRRTDKSKRYQPIGLRPGSAASDLISADIQVLKVQISKTELRAPFDGVIGSNNISLGAEVNRPSTALATIRSIQQLKLDFSVPEQYGRVVESRDSKSSFQFRATRLDVRATVMATEEGIDITTRNLNTRAIGKEQGRGINPGAFANVELQCWERTKTPDGPYAGRYSPGAQQTVDTRRKGRQGKIRNRANRRSTGVERRSGNGIAPGDTIVTTGLLFLKPGSDLKFSKNRVKQAV